jgi:hypothetical protein
MKTGDIIYVSNRFYKIESVILGAIGQQSLIELRSLTERPGRNVDGIIIETTYVPEPLLRGFTVYTPDIGGSSS